MIDALCPLKRYVEHADQTAFQELISTYHSMVFAVCRRVLGSRQASEEAAHETFVKLSRNAVDIRGNVGSWLYTCALNCARDLRHAACSRRRHEQALGEYAQINRGSEFDADEYAILNRCIAELCDRDREAICLYFFMGLTQEQIGRRYAISQVAAKKRVDRALQALRCRLICNGLDPCVNFKRSLEHASCWTPATLLPNGIVDPSLVGLAFVLANHRDLGRWLETFGEGLARVCQGLMLTNPDRLSGRNQHDKFYRSRPSWPQRAANALVSVVDCVREAGCLLMTLLSRRPRLAKP